MKNFFKGIIVGIGGIAPGLSGSVLLVIFGLYQKTINAIGTLFKNFKKNIMFLVPLFLGFGVGVLLFSKVVDYLLNTFEMQTRFAFLGLVIGTIPLFYKEVKKEGFSKKYYILIAISAIAGLLLFSLNKGAFPQIENPNLIQSISLRSVLIRDESYFAPPSISRYRPFPPSRATKSTKAATAALISIKTATCHLA